MERFQIRVAGILLQNDTILLVRQRVSQNREWSLPSGRVEANELLGEAIIREMREETVLTVKVRKLLYLCDKPEPLQDTMHQLN